MSGLVLLDKGHEGCCKGGVSMEDGVEESGGVGGGNEIVGRGGNGGGNVSKCGSVGGRGGVDDGIVVRNCGDRREKGSIGGDAVGGDGVNIVGGLDCRGGCENEVVEVGGVEVSGAKGSVGVHLGGHGRRRGRWRCVGKSACCDV